MIINLGEFNYSDKFSIIEQFKNMAKQLEDSGTVGFLGDSIYYSYEEVIAIFCNEFGEELVIDWLYPFASNLDSFELALESLMNEMFNYFDCRTITDLRNEAFIRFADEKWKRIDEIVDVYQYRINGKVSFVEIMG